MPVDPVTYAEKVQTEPKPGADNQKWRHLDANELRLFSINASAIINANETKLAGIEDNATSDQTGAEIKALYEAESNTNAYTDPEQSKLLAITDTGSGAIITASERNQVAAHELALSGPNSVSGQTTVLNCVYARPEFHGETTPHAVGTYTLGTIESGGGGIIRSRHTTVPTITGATARHDFATNYDDGGVNDNFIRYFAFGTTVYYWLI